MIHPDTDARRILVHERHADLARDARPRRHDRRANAVGVPRHGRKPMALLLVRLTVRGGVHES